MTAEPSIDKDIRNRNKMRGTLYQYNVAISLYQMFLKSTVYEIASQVKWPWKVMDWGSNFTNFEIIANIKKKSIMVPVDIFVLQKIRQIC